MDFPQFTFHDETSATAESLKESTWRDILKTFRLRVTGYLTNEIHTMILVDRMNEVHHRFKLLGFRDYFAGQEGSLRIRLFDATRTERAIELKMANIKEQKLQRIAAYYMAYTGFLPRVKPGEVHNMAHESGALSLTQSEIAN